VDWNLERPKKTCSSLQTSSDEENYRWIGIWNVFFFLHSFLLSFFLFLLYYYFFQASTKGEGEGKTTAALNTKKKKKKGKQYNEHPPQKIKKNPMSVNSAIMDMVVYMRI